MSMPSRADDSFLQLAETNTTVLFATCQCPLGLMTHFYINKANGSCHLLSMVSMPSRADDSFLRTAAMYITSSWNSVNALSGWWLISTFMAFVNYSNHGSSVSMPSRADDSFLHSLIFHSLLLFSLCQCPLGLMTHFYGGETEVEVLDMDLCQCPLGLMTHFYSTPSKT